MKDITSNQVFLLAFPFVIVIVMGLLALGIRTAVRYAVVTRGARREKVPGLDYARSDVFQQMQKTPETEKALSRRRRQASWTLSQNRPTTASNDAPPVRVSRGR